ncbi:hypothetical protein [Geodermatophilus sp. DSM 45219]|uniref:hypothetical protein n=1 Tax=Geodermatophilus sp. DSM 45219 TaxID=1881103 RepID=UPI00088E6F95|nr:hypothetical protein [Geodermatophilus sp. DSM 45219]SDN80640.1 hypothetical protein SAMN05428965_1703 [Geodermatophilus sp. DSM 45219]
MRSPAWHTTPVERVVDVVRRAVDPGVRTGLGLDAVLRAAAVVEEVVGHPLTSSLYLAGGRSRPRERDGSWVIGPTALSPDR